MPHTKYADAHQWVLPEVPRAKFDRERSKGEAAYERRLPEIKAVPEEKLVFRNLDVLAVAETALGAAHWVRGIKAGPDARFELDLERVQALEDYARALDEAHVRHASLFVPAHEARDLRKEAIRARNVLRKDALALAEHGLMDPQLFKRFKGRTGFKAVGFELSGWATAMMDALPKIGTGGGLSTMEDITRAKDLAERLLTVGSQHHALKDAIPASERIRHQALTLVVRTYDQVRREVTYLRWHDGDAEKMMPSLFGKRPRKKKDTPQPNEATPAATEAAAASDTEEAPGAAADMTATAG